MNKRNRIPVPLDFPLCAAPKPPGSRSQPERKRGKTKCREYKTQGSAIMTAIVLIAVVSVVASIAVRQMLTDRMSEDAAMQKAQRALLEEDLARDAIRGAFVGCPGPMIATVPRASTMHCQQYSIVVDPGSKPVSATVKLQSLPPKCPSNQVKNQVKNQAKNQAKIQAKNQAKNKE